MLSRFPMPAVLSVLVSGLFLTACHNEPNHADANKSASAPAASSGSSTDAATKVLTINNGTEPSTLDPSKSSDGTAHKILQQMFVGLVSTNPDGKLIPGLAEKWESADQKVWTFHLRDAKWSNGDPIVAEDFVYSMRRLTDPATASSSGSYLADIKVKNAPEIQAGKAKPDTLGVKAIDNKTLEITLTEPVPYFPSTLQYVSTYPVHRKTIEKFGDKWVQPENIVVSGAYTLKEWVVNSHIKLVKNPAYFDAANVSIPEALFLPISQAAAAVNRYKVGEVDLTSVPADQFAEIKSQYSDQLHINPRLCTGYIEFNHKHAPFDNPKVRQAVSMALDRDIITQKVLGRGETSTYQFTAPATDGYQKMTPQWAQWDMKKRGEEATKLLNEAGFSADKPLNVELLYSTNETGKRMVTAASELWKNAVPFIQISPINQEWKTFLDTRRSGKFDLALAMWCADYNEPSTFLNVMRSNNPNNTASYKNPEYDALLDKALSSGVTPEQRNALYLQAEQKLSDDSVNIFLYNGITSTLINPKLQGYSDKDPMGVWQIKDWKFK